MVEPTIEDFDPKFDLLEISHWLLKAATYAESILKNHPKIIEFCVELRLGAILIANANGQLVGAIQALTPICQLLDDAKNRQDCVREEYRNFRSQVIERICKLYLDALVMQRETNIGPGKPRRKLPNIEQFVKNGDMRKVKEFAQDSWEWKLAIDLAEEKHKSGKYKGLNKMIDEAMEAGHIDDNGDTACTRTVIT